MPLANLQLHHRDVGPGHAYGRSPERRSAPRRELESAQAHQASSSKESATAFRGASKSDLTVVTAEGDRITISQAAQVQYAGNEQASSFQSSSQLRVAVQGNLSDAELKDLGTLLTNLGKATSPAGGQADSGGDAGLARLTSLSAFSYRYQQTVEAGALVRATG